MRTRLNIATVFILTCFVLPGSAANTPAPTDPNRYLDAVRTFADNVLQYGRDTYGPKHTPLFVDGLNIHTLEPVKWIDPDGTKWILSNFASQQTLLRTLDGLSALSDNLKYKQAAIDATQYAFANLRAPNGLLYWGHSLAYDAQQDIVRTSDTDGSRWHTLKLDYPHYQIMWDADPSATKRFIEAYWSAHILDWSNLDMDRASKISQDLEEPWNHQYKEVPAFSRGKGVAFFSTASSLIHAAVFLHRQSGQEEPLIWSKRLAKRYVDTRHPNTGISATTYNRSSPLPIDDLAEHFKEPRTVLFPYDIRAANKFYYPERTHAHGWIAFLQTGLTLGPKGAAFTQWAREELTAWGKVTYRKQDNVFIPMLTDGTILAGYVIKKDNVLGPERTVIQPYPADLSFFWAYSLAYRATGDEFMWTMARNIALGHGFSDIGEDPQNVRGLGVETSCSDAYCLLGFLELYAKTNNPEFLRVAKCIGDNILETRFHKGYFVPSERHTFARFDCLEPLALLHLVAAIKPESEEVPRVWPSCPLFFGRYRHRDKGIDRQIIYPTTESSEPPLSLQEAAAIGNFDLVKTLVDKGVDINGRDDVIFRTALNRAVIGRHKEVVDLLLAEGANPNAKDQWPGITPLHYAVENNSKEITELLLSRGADIEARRDYPAGDTPLHSAVRSSHADMVELLIKKGADVSAKNNDGQTPIDIALRRNHKDISDILLEKDSETSIHLAAQAGDLEKLRSFIETGIDVNEKDESGTTPLLQAVAGGHTDVTEFLLDSGADANMGNRQGVVPLFRALWHKDLDMLELLLKKGADVNTKHARSGFTVLHWAAMMDSKDSVELILDAGADVNAKSNTGETSLDVAAIWGVSTAMAELLVAKGAEVLSLHAAAHLGDLPKVRAFISEGVEVNQKSGLIEGTALHSAAVAGHKEMVEFLISKGANVNAQNGPGQTPLHMAGEKGHLGITQLLIKNGADTDAKDRNGRTPIDLATGAGQRETVEHLQKHEQRFGPKKQAIHDVAVAAVSTQPGCTIGDVISVTLAVNNLGSYAQSFEVELTDSTDGKKIATELAQLGAKNQFESDANLILTGEENGRQNFGDWIEVGDVNGDSYADLLISAAMNDDGRGKAYLYYGGRNMDGTPDKTFAGENKGDHFADGGGYLADMNNDGFDDVVLGARYFKNRGRVYLFFGGPHMDEMPDLVFEPDDEAIGSSFGRGVAVGDLNGDDYNDLIVSAPMQDHGCVYLYFGGEPLDTTVDRIFTGENLVRGFGAVRSARGDVDGDGCDDLLIGTRYGPKRGARARGRAYLFYGARGADMDTAWDVIFEGENDRDEFGTGVDLFDIDNDGHADVIVSARRWNDGEGRAYLYWGGNRDTMDNVPDLYINGELNVMEAFGGDHVVAGYANDDPYGDIVVPAFDYYRFSQHGRVYLYYGDRQSSIDNVYDWTFTGANAGNLTMVARIADFNGDNHGDIVIGGWGFPDNKKQGRVWLYYGGAPSSTDITFTWDTTNASIGKHTLKVEIPPVPGEQNTEDNIKTVTIEVKEPAK